MLLLDAGNVYSLKRGEEPEREMEFILDIMDEQKYDVAVLAAKDLEIPDSSLNHMLEERDFEWVGTRHCRSRKRPKSVKPYSIRKVDGVKVGVFSWLDPEFRFNNVDSTEVLDNLEAMAKELRSKVDVLVLVAHTEEPHHRERDQARARGGYGGAGRKRQPRCSRSVYSGGPWSAARATGAGTSECSTWS
jgi:2',3'-cyclic-nucleotide 2'-phosphodiesterase (5'-nucleotidase family)